MSHLIRSYNSKGRIKAILKKAPSESWYTVFDQEITNTIANHPFVEQFTWIRPNAEDDNLKEPPMEHFVGSKFYLIENAFPNSILSIPYIQKSIVENNGAFISSPALLAESNCAFSIFHRQIKLSRSEKIPELLAIIRTPNTLFRNVINVDKFIKQPPHMKRSNHFSFHKIELSEKSYWNDKAEKPSKPPHFQEAIYDKKYFGSAFGEVLSSHTEIDSLFINPLLSHSNKTNGKNHSNEGNIYPCVHCTSGDMALKDYCFCKAIRESKNPPAEPSCKSLSYCTKGLGNNPFYLSLQKQFGSSLFTKADFLCYFDRDSLMHVEKEAELLKSLETTMRLNGSPDAKITPINVKLLTENVNIKLIEKRGDGSKSISIITGSDASNEHSSDLLAFIDLDTLNSLIQNTSNTDISNSTIFEQIIEYFDIVIHQNLFPENTQKLFNPFESWDYRFDKAFGDEALDAQKSCNLLKYVPLKEAPRRITKAIGLLRPTVLQRYIWFVASQVANGSLLWSLIHLKGIGNSPISINYKPRFSDENSNSVDDLYLLIFRTNEEINILCICAVNHNDANL